ncbi:Uu.00g049460.m01.CDS01 [Anthostomella pinea]|uniref:Uu.00g049460.m01.CDS01 n=1 Tax=Anthostomella pinea TaxID=933095 RepID=A0AAI8VC02_9PEZI|nr:Uu.00g049460.m01.CDS01 [Anthostomella pinea]
MGADHEQEYHVRDLATRAVTLFPSRAQVVRDIKNIPLKQGTNQITIVGLTPNLDEHSIKVEGTGSAIVTDISVELLPNRDIFDDLYPQSDGNDDDNHDDHSETDLDSDCSADTGDLKLVRKNIRRFEYEQKVAYEIGRSAASRLKILESFGKSLATRSKSQSKLTIEEGKLTIEEGIETYRTQREKVFRDHMEGMTKEQDVEKRLAELQRRRRPKKPGRRTRRTNVARNAIKPRRRTASAEKEKLTGPKKVYVVKINLEVSSFTPIPSRRGSVSSDIVKIVSDQEADDALGDTPAGTCDLALSYVTTAAFWSPCYDLTLSTTENSGMLCFDARLTNQTSETWDNCKLVLSTSQTDFSGISDTTPTLTPWRICLAGKASVGSYDDIMYSGHEQARRAKLASQRDIGISHRPRHELFGAGGVSGWPAHRAALAEQAAQSYREPHYRMRRHRNMSFSFARHGQSDQAAYGFSSSAGPSDFTSAPEVVSAEGGRYDFDDAPTVAEQQPELAFQESILEETGLTTTYDLPGFKSLAPSSSTSKQRVARVAFSHVVFSHTVVAKYKAAAYLKAKVRNGSNLTLLKGRTGLTLDGSFLGRTTLPRCSPGGSFSLSLGVDPAVQVAYPKPDVKQSQTGVFRKEDSGMYTRTITLFNTHAGEQGKPMRITVLDQVPVSQDERLRVEVLKPKGLVRDGESVAAGVSGHETTRDDGGWGKAKATLKKGGEIAWDFMVNAGRKAKLNLEYQCVSFLRGITSPPAAGYDKW